MTKKVALIDMDDTLVDYKQRIEEYTAWLSPNGNPTPMHGENIPDHAKNLRLWLWDHPNFWIGADVKWLGFEIMLFLLKYDYEVTIHTRAYTESPNAFTEKVEWFNCYIRHPNIKNVKDIVLLSGSKDILAGDVFVDDNTSNVDSWLTRWPEGLAILPATPYNEGYDHPRAIRIDRNNIEDTLKEFLKIST